MNLENIMNVLGDDTINKLAGSVGGNSDQIKNVIGMAFPSMVEALNKNTNTPEGAEALNKALEKDHDGSILNNISGFLSNFDDASSKGKGILSHLFGNKETVVEETISKNSGLDSGSTTKIMSAIAPLVLGVLGKQKKESGLDAQGLNSLTTMLSGELKQSSPDKMNSIVSLLDKDNDGNVVDDLLDMGGDLLGKFFKK